MATTTQAVKAGKKLVRLVQAVQANPENHQAWGALVIADYDVAVSLRALLVARGQMAAA